MTTNARVQQFAEPLSEIYMTMETAKAEAAAVIDKAKEAGLDAKEIKALRKVAKEMVMMPDKLATKYADEEQLDMFRAQVGIFKRKGLDDTDKAATASHSLGEVNFRKAAKEFDAIAGTDIAGSYAKDRKAVNKFITRSAEHE